MSRTCFPSKSHQFIILTIVISGLSFNSSAQPVQRWQDQQGQWHFGDAAAAKGQKSQPVVISNPISIVHNEQPIPIFHEQQKKPSTTRRLRKGSSVKAPDRCDSLREKIAAQSLKGKTTKRQQDLQHRYDHECIQGVYYGSSNQGR